MNDHPEELLADYVEGSLEPDERAHVEAHLATCERCREEIELATEARGALASLPDLEAPPGIPLAVRRGARGGPSRTWRLAAAAAVAAALIGGGVVVIGNIDLGGKQAADSAGGNAPSAEEGGPAPMPAAGSGPQKSEDTFGAAGLAAAPVVPVYVETRRDYEPARLAPLARNLRDDVRAALDAGLEPTAQAFFADFEPAAFTVPVRQAIRCVLSDVPPSQLIVPFRIEAASFDGTPAYIAAFLQGPTPQDPYDRIVIWVVESDECSLLSLASQVL